MKQFRVIRWLLTMTGIVVCLMGINYAYFTGQLTISGEFETADMKYSFSDGGESLNIILSSEVTMHLMNLHKEEIYHLKYSLNSSITKNVPLKEIDNRHIGSISIVLNDVALNNRKLDATSILYNSIPNSLGIYDCYHDFDGVNGTITLIKQSDPANLELVINKAELNIDEQKQLGIEEPLIIQVIIDNTMQGLEEQKNETDSTLLDDKMQIVETIEIVQELKEIAVINLDATYGFEIPLKLNYDQFNANAN